MSQHQTMRGLERGILLQNGSVNTRISEGRFAKKHSRGGRCAVPSYLTHQMICGFMNATTILRCGWTTIRPYQTLAMNRGEAEKVLRVEIAIQEHDWRSIIERIYPINKRSRFHNQLETCSTGCSRSVVIAINRTRCSA